MIQQFNLQVSGAVGTLPSYFSGIVYFRTNSNIFYTHFIHYLNFVVNYRPTPAPS